MKQIWEQSGDKPCELCKKGFAQTYSDVKNGRFVTACWACLYRK